jgi:hypothetical protein
MGLAHGWWEAAMTAKTSISLTDKQEACARALVDSEAIPEPQRASPARAGDAAT